MFRKWCIILNFKSCVDFDQEIELYITIHIIDVIPGCCIQMKIKKIKRGENKRSCIIRQNGFGRVICCMFMPALATFRSYTVSTIVPLSATGSVKKNISQLKVTAELVTFSHMSVQIPALNLKRAEKLFALSIIINV